MGSNLNVKYVLVEDILPEKGVILDIRSPIEHKIKFLLIEHLFVPMDSIDYKNFYSEHNISSDKIVYIVCSTGNRAKKVAEKFIEAGFNNIAVVKGGIYSWNNHKNLIGGSVVSNFSMKDISLDRQVRIVAGATIVISFIIGWTLLYYFMYVPLIVGCALVYSGVSGSCILASLLAAAPWNKNKEPEK